VTTIGIASRPLSEADHRAQRRPAGAARRGSVRANAVIDEVAERSAAGTNVRLGSENEPARAGERCAQEHVTLNDRNGWQADLPWCPSLPKGKCAKHLRRLKLLLPLARN
jgi:hypothetical protein